MPKKWLIILGIVVAVILAVFFWNKSRRLTTGKTLPDAAAGPQIAFLADGELVVYDHATGEFSQLTQANRRVRNADWSPDGRYLVFEVDAKEKDNDILYRLDVTDGKLLRLTPVGFPDCHMPVWSPDGQWIACYTDSSSLNSEIFLIQPDGTGATPLTNGTQPSWSADSQRLIYILRKDLTTNVLDNDMATIDIQSGTVAFLAELDGYQAFPKWSPDEKMIAYVSADSPWGYGNAHDFSINISNGDSITVVSDTPSVYDIYYKWSSDGAAFRFSNCQYYPASDETDCRGSVFSQLIDFSPDGRTILQVDKDKLCLIPIENDCVETSKILKPGWLRVIGWRPSSG
ncbi:MAG: TolB family protein [Anaerolineae bacterium]